MAGPARLTPTGLQPGSAETFVTYVSGTPLAKTPLTGTELVPMVQGGAVVHSPPNVAGFGPPVRTILTANTNYYVAMPINGGSDSNPGTLASPWATIDHAFAFIGENVDGGGFFVRLNIGAGSFAGAGLRPMTGLQFLHIQGSGSSGVNKTTITAGPSDGIFNFGECIDNPANYVPTSINGVRCSGFGGAPAIANYQIGSQLSQGGDFTGVGAPDMAFDCTGASFCVLDAAPGFISDGAVGNFVVAPIIGGGATLQAFAIAENNTLITLGTGYAVSGALAVTTGFLQAFNSGVFVLQNAGGNTITGAGVTGPRYSSQDSSAIGGSAGTGTLGRTYLPGNADGVVDAGSTYDGFLGATSGTGIPTTTQFPDPGTSSTYKDTSGGGVYDVYNDGGTLKFDALGVTPVAPGGVTFANLPASPSVGVMAAINDGLAGNCADGTCTTFGTNVTGGGGALKLNLWYNGTHWTLVGK